MKYILTLIVVSFSTLSSGAGTCLSRIGIMIAPLIGTVTQEQIAEITVTPEVFRKSNLNLDDIRLSDQTGKEIPFQILAAEPVEQFIQIPHKIVYRYLQRIHRPGNYY